jgi:hypothetical protein
LKNIKSKGEISCLVEKYLTENIDSDEPVMRFGINKVGRNDEV